MPVDMRLLDPTLLSNSASFFTAKHIFFCFAILTCTFIALIFLPHLDFLLAILADVIKNYGNPSTEYDRLILLQFQLFKYLPFKFTSSGIFFPFSACIANSLVHLGKYVVVHRDIMDIVNL